MHYGTILESRSMLHQTFIHKLCSSQVISFRAVRAGGDAASAVGNVLFDTSDKECPFGSALPVRPVLL